MRLTYLLTATMLFVGCCGTANQDLNLMKAEDFRTTVDGKATDLYTIKNGDLTMQVTNFGARVVSLWMPDREGKMADIVLGYQNIDRYINNGGERFLGSVVGRVANRIGNGKFTLDGVEYTTPQNNNGQTLHGGLKGVDMVVWDVVEATENSLHLTYTAPDGQDGFPGNLTINMTYTLTENNEFKVAYSATTDKTTPVNLSHHSFFNLKGEAGGTITDHILQIDADHITPTDANLIPTGELLPVEGTPFDFRTPHAIGDMIDADNEQLKNGRGYDMNWVLNRPDNGEVVKVMSIYDPQSGRGFEVYTDQIALQFYSGNFFDGSYNGKYGKPLSFRESVVFETQKYPDAVNHPHFPSVVLNPGEEYAHTCIYKFILQ
ncbi:MAG: galactose mutarotase [Alistipes sp.]|nr:galactose mutarotase [Alistipes sp.]MBQ9962977.1 galactose mutarotase [Alistipes sp.]